VREKEKSASVEEERETRIKILVERIDVLDFQQRAISDTQKKLGPEKFVLGMYLKKKNMRANQQMSCALQDYKISQTNPNKDFVIGPTYKRTEGSVMVRGSEFTTKDAHSGGDLEEETLLGKTFTYGV
jgi:hypothetical protein